MCSPFRFPDLDWVRLRVLYVEEKTAYFMRDSHPGLDYVHRPGETWVKWLPVRFQLNRFPLQAMHRALCRVNQGTMLERLFPLDMLNPKPSAYLYLDLFNEKIEDNPMQLQAVQNIVDGTSHPAPYILFGPPGTGKTLTLVEAISQVCHRDKDSKILVCAPSNPAADLLAEKLLDNIGAGNIMRPVSVMWYAELAGEAPSETQLKVSDRKLKEDCPIREIVVPTEELNVPGIKKKRIVVATLTYTAHFVTLGLSANHFTHMFVDEAGQATEPETIIPVAGLLNRYAKNYMQ